MTSEKSYKFNLSEDKFWQPDLFFIDEKEAKRHEIFKRNAMLTISSVGQVFFSERLTVKVACQMNLKWFPFDHQEKFYKYIGQ